MGTVSIQREEQEEEEFKSELQADLVMHSLGSAVSAVTWDWARQETYSFNNNSRYKKRSMRFLFWWKILMTKSFSLIVRINSLVYVGCGCCLLIPRSSLLAACLRRSSSSRAVLVLYCVSQHTKTRRRWSDCCNFMQPPGTRGLARQWELHIKKPRPTRCELGSTQDVSRKCVSSAQLVSSVSGQWPCPLHSCSYTNARE